MNISPLLRCLLALASPLLFTLPLFAQSPTVWVESVTADVNEEVAVEVYAIGFDTLVSIQFSLSWDTTLFVFNRVEDIAMDGLAMSNFNLSQLDSGRIGYLETDSSLNGFGLPDNSSLFTLVLNPITTVSTGTSINFSEAPMPPHANGTNNTSVIPEYAVESGMITLNGSNSVIAVAEDPRLKVSPNPFNKIARIAIDLDYGGAAMIEVLDIAGRLVDRRSITLSSTRTLLDLSANAFPTNGTYILRLTTAQEQLHRKIILQGH